MLSAGETGARAMGFRRKYLMPRGMVFDRIEHWLSYVKTHRRLPDRRRKLLSDVLYDQMTSGRLLDPLVQLTSDKEYVKAHVDGVLGRGHTIPTLAILRSAAEIDSYDFAPGTFVKPTHLSGKLAPIRGAADVDVNVDRAVFKSWLRRNYYDSNREHCYRFLTPKVIVEPMVFDGVPFRELKFYVYRGASRLGFEATDTEAGRVFLKFGRDLVAEPYDARLPCPDRIDPPRCMDALWDAAERLGAPFEFVRVDFLTDGGDRFVVNELTHSEGAGRYPYRSRRHPHLACEYKVSKLLFGDGT